LGLWAMQLGTQWAMQKTTQAMKYGSFFKTPATPAVVTPALTSHTQGLTA
jgi:hypothetical protein